MNELGPYRSATSAACPRCALLLLSTTIAGTELGECPGCAGLFVSRDALVQMIRTRDDVTAQAFIDAFGDQVAEPIGQRAVTYVHCPACATIMTRTQFAKGAKVIIDLCTCGVWFDAGELASVIRFVIAGGLDRAAERIASDTARDAAAQGSSGPMVKRHVTNRFARNSQVLATPSTPRQTAAIWSVFETLVKPTRKP